MEEIVIQERRLDLLKGALILGGVTCFPLFLFYLINSNGSVFRDSDFTVLVAFYFLLTVIGFGIFISLAQILSLLFKMISPYKIILSDKGFYDSNLRQFISWGMVDKIGYLDINEVSKKTLSSIIGLFCWLLLLSILCPWVGLTYVCKIGMMYELLASKQIKIPVIYTKNKKELIKKAGLLLKYEMLLYKANMIRINLEESASIDADKLIQLMQEYRNNYNL